MRVFGLQNRCQSLGALAYIRWHRIWIYRGGRTRGVRGLYIEREETGRVAENAAIFPATHRRGGLRGVLRSWNCRSSVPSMDGAWWTETAV